MTAKRSEPFLQALTEVRRRISEGHYPAEARLTAAALAAELDISPTPMREALARLAGEGLLEDRRGQGFFLRRLSTRDIADLYRLNLEHLEIALQEPRATTSAGTATPAESGLEPADAIRATDRLFAGWVTEAGGAVLTRSYRRVHGQLTRARGVEIHHLDDLPQEYAELVKEDSKRPAQRLPRVRTFFRRRIRIAAKLAESLEPRPEAS
jgi:DNA-binding GntR family transcriptional regulator